MANRASISGLVSKSTNRLDCRFVGLRLLGVRARFQPSALGIPELHIERRTRLLCFLVFNHLFCKTWWDLTKNFSDRPHSWDRRREAFFSVDTEQDLH
jgi:hypothetical protein